MSATNLAFPNPADATDAQLCFWAEAWGRLMEQAVKIPTDDDASYLASVIHSVWTIVGAELNRRIPRALDDEIKEFFDEEGGEGDE